MTTPRDLETAAEVSLPICDRCGWYSGHRHAERCDPAQGRLARKLIDQVPDVRSGQLGYGDDKVVFEISADLVILFTVDRGKRPFALSDVTSFKGLSVEASAGLVRALQRWAEEFRA